MLRCLLFSNTVAQHSADTIRGYGLLPSHQEGFHRQYMVCRLKIPGPDAHTPPPPPPPPPAWHSVDRRMSSDLGVRHGAEAMLV